MRTFIAIDIPREIKDKIYELQSRLKELDIKASYPHKKNLEITLAFLGEKTEEEIKDIKENLSNINFKGFEIKLKNLGSFPNINIMNNVWVGIESEDISSLVSEICKSIDFKLDKPFNPHITLCRIKNNKNTQSIRELILKNKNVDLGSFKAENFVLKKSTLTKDGPIYSNIETFDLN
jgi:RNA 2',3'-cyclic 3'-phosphodiesterase